MKSEKQGGFTLIELVVVIVILGILAATALPKFVDLRSDAGSAGAQGVAGAFASAGSINYSTCLARNYGAGCTRLSTSGLSCNTQAGTLLQGGVPSGYTVSGTMDCSGTNTSADCTVTHTSTSQGATASILCTG